MRNYANPGPVWDDDPPPWSGMPLVVLVLLVPPIGLVVCLWLYHHGSLTALTRAALGWSAAMTVVLVVGVVLFTADSGLAPANLTPAGPHTDVLLID